MNTTTAFARTSGSGDNIVCLHSSLGSSRQWSGFIDQLDTAYRVTATDLYGYGNSPAWNQNRSLTLDDEVDLLAPLLDAMHGPIHLVGHSYGAAVTLKIAQTYAGRIHSLSIYEPVMFSTLFARGETLQIASEVLHFKNEIQQDCRFGRVESATRKFIDYWSGAGAWDFFSSEQQVAMCSQITAVLKNFDAVLAEKNILTSLGNLHIPTLCLYGEHSPHSSRLISQILGDVLPEAKLRLMHGMGHMGPITHARTVNDEIAIFIESQVSDLDEYQVPYAA